MIEMVRVSRKVFLPDGNCGLAGPTNRNEGKTAGRLAERIGLFA
jgi:hypothetical protein